VSSFHCLRRLGTLCLATLSAVSPAGCASMAPQKGVAEIGKATGAIGLTATTWAAGAMPTGKTQ